MSNYWKDFECMGLAYSFEAYDERSGYSDGESFDNLADAMAAFNAWTLEDGGAASAKHVTIDVLVPTDRGELDIFKSFEAIKEER